MAGLSAFNSTAKKVRHLCAYTPSTDRSFASDLNLEIQTTQAIGEMGDKDVQGRPANLLLTACLSASSDSMCSLPICSPIQECKETISFQASTNFSQDGRSSGKFH